MNRILQENKKLYDMGFAIHLLHVKAKRPIESGWTKGPRKDWSYLAETCSDPQFNVGVRLGTPSKIGSGYLAVIDVDVKSMEPQHKNEANAAVKKLIGDIKLPRVISGRGNGSCHYYCLTAEPFNTFNPFESTEQVKVFSPSKSPSKKELEELTTDEIKKGFRIANAWEISLYSEGRQVVLPPSIHPDSGKAYKWTTNLTSKDSLPLLKFELPAKNNLNKKAENRIELSVNKPTTLEGFEVVPIDIESLGLREDVQNGILYGTDVEDRSNYIMKATRALYQEGLSINEILSVLTDRETYLGNCSYEHANTNSRYKAAAWLYKYGVKKVLDSYNPSEIFTEIADGSALKVLAKAEMSLETKEITTIRNWKQSLRRSKEGSVVDTLNNVDAILSNTVQQPVFVHDEFSIRDSYGVDTSWEGKNGEHIADIDTVLIKSWLAKSEFKIEPKDKTINDTISLLAYRNKTHPVRVWLNSCKWDKKKRIDTWIKDYLGGIADEPYLSDISRKFLIAMVARVFEPGCQWDYTLILEGKQGTKKSSTARILASEKWFCDHLPDLKDKDAMLYLQGSWLIELAELKDVKRTDANTVKAFLTRRTDRFRAPYGKRWLDSKRQSVFIGTVNENEYFKDPTGNRRFWPVKILQCDVEALERDRDQLFAEAKWIYDQSNEKLCLEGLSEQQAVEAQESRRLDDDETEMLELLIDFIQIEFEKPETEKFNFNHFRSRQLFTCPNAPWARWLDKNYSKQTAALVLSKLGFKKKTINGQRIWGDFEQKVSLLNSTENFY